MQWCGAWHRGEEKQIRAGEEAQKGRDLSVPAFYKRQVFGVCFHVIATSGGTVSAVHTLSHLY